MTRDAPIELSLHRVRDGDVQLVGARHYLYEHQFATVEDEEMVSINTPDGGSALVVGAGPNGRGAVSTDVDFSVEVLSEQLAQIIHSYAGDSGMVIARWPLTPETTGYRYAWDPQLDASKRAAEAEGLEVQVRSVPTAVFVTTEDQVRHLPSGWPDPAVCAIPEELFEELT
jgi:hypothetical protein